MLIPNSHHNDIWRWGFWEVIRFRGSHECGFHGGISTIIRRETRGPLAPRLRALTEEGPCEDTARRQPDSSQEERPHQESSLWAPWSGTSSLQDCEKQCLSYLWHFMATQTDQDTGGGRGWERIHRESPWTGAPLWAVRKAGPWEGHWMPCSKAI